MAQRQNDDQTRPSQRSRGATAKPSGRRSAASEGAREQTGIVSKVGPIEIDWPRSLGYFGGLGLAVAVGVIDPPVGLFIAAVPFLKMLDLPRGPQVTKFLGQVFEGVAKPVGGDGQGTVRLVTSGSGADSQPVGQS